MDLIAPCTGMQTTQRRRTYLDKRQEVQPAGQPNPLQIGYPMIKKSIIVELLGFSALVLIAVLYNIVEKSYGGFAAIFISIVVLIPTAILWRLYRTKFNKSV